MAVQAREQARQDQGVLLQGRQEGKTRRLPLQVADGRPVPRSRAEEGQPTGLDRRRGVRKQPEQTGTGGGRKQGRRREGGPALDAEPGGGGERRQGAGGPSEG